MKKILLFFTFLSLCILGYSQATTGTRITSAIVPNDESDPIATTDSKYVKGGFHQVSRITERDSILPSRRTEGMCVYVKDDSIVYQLRKGITSSNWVNAYKDITGGSLDSSKLVTKHDLTIGNNSSNLFLQSNNSRGFVWSSNPTLSSGASIQFIDNPYARIKGNSSMANAEGTRGIDIYSEDYYQQFLLRIGNTKLTLMSPSNDTLKYRFNNIGYNKIAWMGMATSGELVFSDKNGIKKLSDLSNSGSSDGSVQAYNDDLYGNGGVVIFVKIDVDTFNFAGHTLTYNWTGPADYTSITKSDAYITSPGLYQVIVTDVNTGKTYKSVTNVYYLDLSGGGGSYLPYTFRDTIQRFGSGNIKLGINNIRPSVVTGNSNISIGDGSLWGVTTGYSNIAVGSYALNPNSTGNYNTALGYYAGTNTTGSNNIMVGSEAGVSNGSLSNRIYINSLNRTNLLGDTTKSPIYILQDIDMSKQTIYLNGVVKVNGANIGSGSSTEDTLYISSVDILAGINDTLVNTTSPTTLTQIIYTTCLISYRHVSTAYTGGITDTIAVFGKYKGVPKKILYISSIYITDAYSGRGQFPITWDKLDPGSPIWVHIPSFSTGDGILRMRFKKITETW